MKYTKKKRRASTRSRSAELAAEMNSVLGQPVLKLASDPDLKLVRIPSPSLTINRVTGGGFVRGRHVELYGDPSVGKSAIMYGTMALSQRRGNICALVDPEGVFDAEWFSHLGGYPEELLYERPEDAEEFLGVARMLLQFSRRGDPIEICGVDSIAALVTKEQVEQPPEKEERVASQARLMSRALRLLTTKNRNVLFLWVNQERERPGIFFGNPRTGSGGRALGYYATTRIEMRSTARVDEERKKAVKGKIEKKKVKTGQWIQVRAEKEKSTKPYATGSFIFDSDHGRIDLASEIIQLGLEDEIIERRGNRYSYETIDGDEVIESLKGWRALLEQDEDLKSELTDAINDMTLQLAKVGSNGA